MMVKKRPFANRGKFALRPVYYLPVALAFVLIAVLSKCIFPAATVGASPFWQVYDFGEPVVRIHIIAHNDSIPEQKLKNVIQKKFVHVLSSRFKDTALNELLQELDREKPHLEAAISTIAEKEGFNHSIGIHLQREIFPLRHYAGKVYPPGEYLALKIEIGEAKGENWWCLIYPPLCFPAARLMDDHPEIEENSLPDGKEPDGGKKEGRGPGRWRFRIWDWIRSWRR